MEEPCRVERDIITRLAGRNKAEAPEVRRRINDPCSPGRSYLGRAVPPNYPLTDRLQFDIL